MGNGPTKIGGGDYNAYEGAMDHYAKKWHGADHEDNIEGGDGCCSGGAETKKMPWDKLSLVDLRDYDKSLNSFVKDSLTADIVEALKSLGFAAEGNTREEQIDSILKKIPSSRVNGRAFKADAESHKRVCLKLADVINKRYGEIIDKRLEPHVVCQQVADVIASLKSSMHVEFLSVYNEVRRVLRNLAVLHSEMTDVFQPIIQQISKSDDTKMKASVEKWISLYSLVNQHTEQQTKILQNLLDVTLTPSEVTLAGLVKADKENGNLISKLKDNLKPGSSAFGEYISEVLRGLTVTPAYALVIDKALKSAGMTIDEYAKADLPALMQKMMDATMNKEGNDAQLHELIESWDLLYKNFSRAKDIAAQLDRIKKSEKSGEYEMYGAADLEPTNVEKKIRDRRVVRNLVFQVFNRQLNEQFNRIVVAIDSMANKVGDGVPPSDQLEGFIKSIKRLTGTDGVLVNRRNAYVALIGYYNDAKTKEYRDTFLANLRIIQSYVDTMNEMPQYRGVANHLKDVADNIKAMIQLIDQYADKVSQKFGGDDDDKEETCLALGGAPDLINDNIKLPESVILRTSNNLLEAITKMEYLYKVSQIKNNLKHVEKENERFAEGYEDLRADSVAKKVQELLAQQTRLLEQLDDKDGEGHGKQETPYLWTWEKMPDGQPKRDAKKRLEHLRQSAIKYVQKQFEARINFWKTIEAIDEYMRVFTNGLVKDPNAVRDLKAMLDETENLSDWYNEKVGQDLHQIFDCFPAYIEGTGTDAGTGNTPEARFTDAAGKVTAVGAVNSSNVRLPSDAALRSDTADHYYDKVHTAFDNFAGANNKTDVGAGRGGGLAGQSDKIAAHLPGNPYLVANPDNTEVGFSGKVHAKRTIQHLFALKNLIACFTYIGQKFAGEEIRKKVFMSPTQMYKNLVDYLDASAFGVGLGSVSYIHDPFFDTNYENTMADRTFDPSYDRNMKNIEARVAELEQTPWVRALGRAPEATSRNLGEALTNLRNMLASPVSADRSAEIMAGFTESIAAAARLPANKRDKNAVFHLVDQYRLMRATTRVGGVALAIPAVAAVRAGDVATVLNALTDVKNMHDQANLLHDRKAAPAPANMSALWTANNVEDIIANPNTWYTNNHAALDGHRANYSNLLRIVNAATDDVDPFGKPIYGITYRGAYQGGSLESFSDDAGANNRARTYNFDTQTWGAAHPVAARSAAAGRANHILVRLGVTAKPVAVSDPAFAEVDFRRRFGVYMRSVIKEFNGGAADKELDQFFARSIKAIAAKVLTIVGMYDVMERPHEVQVMNPVRMILGAADDTPKIEPAAVELYIRLPLLLEFYRDLFGFNKDDAPEQSWVNIDNDEQKFTLLPEMEGTFAGLVRLLFKKSKNISMNNLSDQDLRDIIKEINMIYAKNSGKGDSLVIDTVRELIDEMNRRFGLLKKRERDRYEKDFGYHYDYDNAYNNINEMLPRDIAILPDEDKVMAWDEAPVSAPSDRYLQKAAQDTPFTPARESKNKIRDEHYKLFYRFRCMLDNYFRNGNNGRAYTMGGPESDYSFKPAIKQAMIELKNEANNDERFKIVTRLIRGYSAFRRVDLHKYVLFHETVVTGLNTLSGIYTLLVNYKNLILATDLKRISEELSNVAPAAGAVDNLARLKALIRGENYRQPNAHIDGLLDKFSRAADAGYAAANATDISTAANKEDVLRQIMNYPLIMRHLIETIFTMSNDLGGLVQFSFSDRIALNWSGLREAIEQTFAQVRYFMDLLRPHIAKELFDRFVSKDNVGSFYWLQEQLMDKILVGRDAGVTETEPNEFENRVQYLNIEQLTVKLNDTYRHLVRAAGASVDEWTPAVAADPATARRVAYDQVFASMIFYDAKHAGNNSGIVGCKQVGPRNAAELIDFGKPINTLLLKPQGDKWMFFPNQSNRYVQLYSWNDEPEFTFQRSLMLGFNQLLAKMIHQFYDPAVGKVYLNLFNPLISGALNAQVMNPDACYPDTIRTREPTNVRQDSAANNVLPSRDYPTGSVGVVPAGNRGKALDLPTLIDTPFITVQRTDSTQSDGSVAAPRGMKPPALGHQDSLYSFGRRADPKPEAILFSSLALVLKNIASGKNKMGQAVYAAENIADVSSYMKDKYKAQLPVFKNLFNILIRKGELLKTLISKRDDNMLNLSRGDLSGVLTPAPVGVILPPADPRRNARTNATPGMYGLADMGALNAAWMGAAGNDKTARDWTALIDALNKACQGAIAGIDQVMRELADSPKYLELNPGFINDYRNNYKKDPFMPLSSLLTVFKNNQAGEPYPHLPFFNPGAPEYKLAYGERQVLAQPDTPVSMDQLPGHKALIDAYNMGAGKDAANKEAVDKYTTNVVKLLRYVNEAKQYRANLLNMWNDAWSLGRVSALLEAGADVAARDYVPALANGHFLQDLLIGGPLLGADVRSNTLVTVLSDRKPNDRQKWIVPAFALSHENRLVVDLTENSFRDQKLEEFVKYLHDVAALPAPDLKVQNILDLNVVPINVNAMMRDIPLVNIYNYAYTFDRLIVELLFGIQSDVANDILKHLCQNVDPNAADFRDKIARSRVGDPNYMRDSAGAASRAALAAPRTIRSTKDLFLALLVDPYRELLNQEEWDYLNGVFTGDNNMDLGRPKFLSDQLYNKALFMELYPATAANEYQERGPRRKQIDVSPAAARAGNTTTLTYITNKRKNNSTVDVDDHDDQEFDYQAQSGAFANTGLKVHNLNENYKEVLRILSKLRAQTVFVRNIVFLVNVYRLLRLKLRKDLVYNKGLVLKGHAVVRESNTEFARNQDYRPYKWA